ncbi:MAG TPA: hypothetical protein PKA16_03630 [Ottowia sp.]|uniref:hypothetical protein n=1 Tax=Ottowia sp. TaxID=1898956 RepID=UPI002C0A287B|nr:hypothetical protein [Ottowia sp.]HMN20464.1 hypothetical protein [Ottowia sp.]
MLALWLAGVVAAAALLLAGGASRLPAPRLALLLAAALGTGLGLRRFWRGQQAGELVWDGANWWLHVDGRERPLASVEVRLDLQRALLLHGVDLAGVGGRWCWAQAARHGPARWHLLRCALYSGSPPRHGPASSSEAASG